jgi:hypothetical protein
LKNVEAVFAGSDSIGLRGLVEPCFKGAVFSETADAEIAESCTIPPRGYGVVINAKVRDEQAMRVVHEILCTFGAPLTENNQNVDHRLVSIGISKVDSIGTHPSRAIGASAHMQRVPQ